MLLGWKVVLKAQAVRPRLPHQSLILFCRNQNVMMLCVHQSIIYAIIETGTWVKSMHHGKIAAFEYKLYHTQLFLHGDWIADI